jgi:hypothetical protein
MRTERAEREREIEREKKWLLIVHRVKAFMCLEIV